MVALHEGEHFGQREGGFLGDLFGFLDGIFWSHTARASEGHEKQSQAGPKSVRVQGWGGGVGEVRAVDCVLLLNQSLENIKIQINVISPKGRHQ